MSEPAIGKKAPAFKLPSTSGQTVSLRDFAGQNLVLYFYHRDNTPGCTTESNDFKELFARFKRCDTQILGVSQDKMASHEKFRDKLSLPFHLASDESGEVCNKYAVIKLKKMYGKEFEGIERSTFLIDDKGILRQAWRKVRVPGHVEEVLQAAKAR